MNDDDTITRLLIDGNPIEPAVDGSSGITEWAIKALALGFFAWVVWFFLQPRYAFEVRIVAGKARLRKGKVTPAFLDCVTEVCQETGVARGWIGGVQHGRRTVLRFSRHFPPAAQQRLRNEWQLAR